MLSQYKIKKLFKIFIIYYSIHGSIYPVFANPLNNENSFTNYLKLIENNSIELGKSINGEIEIIKNVNEILKIEKKRKQSFIKKGYTPEEAHSFSKVGIVFEDPYWLIIRDATKTDKGTGTYNRLLWKNSLDGGSPGVAILPLLPDGKFLFISTFRHATRSWELELSRGGREKNEDNIEAAKRELQEETGYKIKENKEKESILFLGNMTPDSGTLNSVIPIYLIQNLEKSKKSIEEMEAINSNISLTCKETLNVLKNGFYEYTDKNNKIKKLMVRDSFINSAILQYIIHSPKNNCF
ncbi:NUDIX hydrolase [Silvanigrella paludirubra]|nr:NUDIX hydrolase [Silvanigrella paludirubra]